MRPFLDDNVVYASVNVDTFRKLFRLRVSQNETLILLFDLSLKEITKEVSLISTENNSAFLKSLIKNIFSKDCFNRSREVTKKQF